MTQVMPVSEALEDDFKHVVPVKIVASATAENDIADLVSFQTLLTIGVNDQAQQLLSRSTKRQRAYLRVSPGAAGNTTGYILIGSMVQVQAGLGFRLYNGQDLQYTAKGEVWMKGDNVNSLAMSVQDERYSE